MSKINKLKNYLLCAIILVFIVQLNVNASVTFYNKTPILVTENSAEFSVYNNYDGSTRITVYYIKILKNNVLYDKTDPHFINPYCVNKEILQVPTDESFIVKVYTSIGVSNYVLTDIFQYTFTTNVKCLDVVNKENTKIEIHVKNNGINGLFKYIIKQNGTTLSESTARSINTLSTIILYTYAPNNGIPYTIEIYSYINNEWIKTDEINELYRDPQDIIITDPTNPELT